MRRPGIEPGASRWQRDILPLNQRRMMLRRGTFAGYIFKSVALRSQIHDVYLVQCAMSCAFL